jgi:hypothetical protein
LIGSLGENRIILEEKHKGTLGFLRKHFHCA